MHFFFLDRAPLLQGRGLKEGKKCAAKPMLPKTPFSIILDLRFLQQLFYSG